MSDRDYYEILGLTPSADGQMVDQAYWHLVRKYQSLAATNVRAQSMIDELNEAYGVLGNPRLREQYDAFRDEVLIRTGMIKPVRSKPKKLLQAGQEPQPAPKKARERKERSLPSLPVPQHWRTYTVAALIALLAFAAAWQGVNIVLVVVALAVGLGLSLTPTISKRVSEFTFEMPTLQMPEVRAPKLEIPKVGDLAPSMLRDLGASQKDEGIDADTLSVSTRDTIARWRRSVGLRVTQSEDEPASEPVLDMRDPEQKPNDDGDPFGAVMDILRSGARTAPEKKIS